MSRAFNQANNFENNQKSQETQHYNEIADKLLSNMTDAELEILISCGIYEEFPPEFLQKWGSQLEIIGKLEYYFMKKWGELPNVNID